MSKSRAASVARRVQQISVRLEEQAQEIRRLQRTADIQFNRIAHMQAELDTIPVARKRRQIVRALLRPFAAHANNNGNPHSE